jgi:NAD(P)-dependent dehydrogenase (short-subunit alcohol dehydrogenase family)
VARVVVTGSSRGIGLAFCAALKERGDEVFAVCRTATPELEALGVTIVDGVDVTDDEAVARIPAALGDEPLDLLISNAGMQFVTRLVEDLDPKNLLQEYNTNALGAVRVVLAVLPHLREGSKIALISTGGAASVTNNDGRISNYGYRMSKGGLNVFGVNLANELRPRGIAVVLLGPGPVDTDLLRNSSRSGTTTNSPQNAAQPAEAVSDMLDRIDELTLESTGRWISRQGRPYG